MTRGFRPIALSCTLILVGAAPARAAEFYRLGEDDLANGVSPDGSLVLTTRNVWTPGGGFVPFSPEVLVYSRDIANNGYVVGLVVVAAHDALRSITGLLHDAMLERRGETPMRKRMSGH